MTSRCLTCHSEFLELDLLEGRCIGCWRGEVKKYEELFEGILPVVKETRGIVELMLKEAKIALGEKP